MKLVFTSALLFGLMLSATAAPRETEPARGLRKRPAGQNKTAGFTFIWRARPRTSASRTAIHLAQEIKVLQKIIALELTHDSGKDYEFFRAAAEKRLWPQVEAEYREELRGIVQGLNAKNVKLDIGTSSS